MEVINKLTNGEIRRDRGKQKVMMVRSLKGLYKMNTAVAFQHRDWRHSAPRQKLDATILTACGILGILATSGEMGEDLIYKNTIHPPRTKVMLRLDEHALLSISCTDLPPSCLRVAARCVCVCVCVCVSMCARTCVQGVDPFVCGFVWCVHLCVLICRYVSGSVCAFSDRA